VEEPYLNIINIYIYIYIYIFGHFTFSNFFFVRNIIAKTSKNSFLILKEVAILYGSMGYGTEHQIGTDLSLHGKTNDSKPPFGCALIKEKLTSSRCIFLHSLQKKKKKKKRMHLSPPASC
jgi:hypothetical protein